MENCSKHFPVLLGNAQALQLGQGFGDLREIFGYPMPHKFVANVRNLSRHIHSHQFLRLTRITRHGIPNFVTQSDTIAVGNVASNVHVVRAECSDHREKYRIIARPETVIMRRVVE